jgi:hypothetical protein
MKTPSLSQFRTVAILFTVPLLLTGCAQPRASDGVLLSQQPEAVILLRGVAGETFSKGMDELAARLQREGHPTIVTSYVEWMSLANARAENARPCRAIIGHSAGADHGIEIARALNRRGVDVEYLFLFDPSLPLTIPPNVHRCYNFMSPFPVGKGISVLPDLGNTRTAIANEVKWNLSHLDIDDNLALQDFIISRLRSSDLDGERLSRVTRD